MASMPNERPLMGALQDAMASGQDPNADAGQDPTFPVSPEGFKMAQMMAKKTGGTVMYCVEPPQQSSDQQDAGPAPRGI